MKETRMAEPGDMTGDVALRAQLQHFADVVAGKEQPLVSAIDAAHAVAVCQAIHDSSHSGERIIVLESL